MKFDEKQTLETLSNAWDQGKLNSNNINVILPDGFTHLTKAISLGYKDLVEFLLGKGADVTTCDGNGKTPLEYIPPFNEVLIKELLVKKKIFKTFENVCKEGKLNIKNIDDILNNGYTHLTKAISLGFKVLIEFLINNRADINKPNGNDWTPLYYSVLLKNFDIMKLLVDKGADIDKCKKDEHVIFIVLPMDNYELSKLFIDKMKDLNCKAADGQTLVEKTINIGKYFLANDLANKKDVDLTIINKFGENLLHILLKKLKYDKPESQILGINLLKTFLEKHPEKENFINHSSISGDTPLLIAVTEGLKSAAEILIENGANRNYVIPYTGTTISGEIDKSNLLKNNKTGLALTS